LALSIHHREQTAELMARVRRGSGETAVTVGVHHSVERPESQAVAGVAAFLVAVAAPAAFVAAVALPALVVLRVEAAPKPSAIACSFR
jgi:hypothetical protein